MNKVTIQPTIFENHPLGTRTYGYRIYDDCGQTYCNTWEFIPDDDLDILRQVLEDYDETAQAMLTYISDSECGLLIGQEPYSWDRIKHLFIINTPD